MKVETKGKLTFPGGVHPKGGKKLAEDSKIETGPSVKQVSILLSQHIGAPCNPLVKKGDKVTAGQKIGDSDAFVSAPVHSPVNGTVKQIGLETHAVLGRTPAITIEADEENNPQRNMEVIDIENFDENKYTSEQICEKVRQAGIVGMGGAGFPTRVKIEPNPQMPKEIMIVNGCECEPCITCDYRLMLEHSRQIIAGIKLAKKASGCTKVYIGIEDNKPRAIKVMAAALKSIVNTEDISVVAVKTKYPQGGERQLIRSILKRHVPTGSIPPMIGVLVLNVATAGAIAEAVIAGRPLTHRIVTVTGQAVAKPSNLYVPIGTPVNDLIEFCGGVTMKSAKVVMGGPMMGIAIADLNMPITKTTGSITILTKDQIGKAKFERRQTPCIRCGRCLEVCPENLNPTKLAHAVKYGRLDIAQDHYISACIECGCCSYICPANIEITGHIKTGKIFIAREKKKMPE